MQAFLHTFPPLLIIINKLGDGENKGPKGTEQSKLYLEISEAHIPYTLVSPSWLACFLVLGSLAVNL